MIVLLGHGTEDFSDELGVTPDGRSVRDDPGSSHPVFLVGERRPLAGSSLDGDSVASPRKVVHRVRREGDPAFAGRQRAHQTDPHSTLSKRSSSTILKGYPEGGRRSNRARQPGCDQRNRSSTPPEPWVPTETSAPGAGIQEGPILTGKPRSESWRASASASAGCASDGSARRTMRVSSTASVRAAWTVTERRTASKAPFSCSGYRARISQEIFRVADSRRSVWTR